MRLETSTSQVSKKRPLAFTLMEVVTAIVIIAVVFGGILMAYIQATRRAQWSGYSLAAQAMAIQQLEQARAANWDPTRDPVNDARYNDFTNLTLLNKTFTYYSGNCYVFTGYSTNYLDLPTSGTNYVMVTNFVTIIKTNLWVNGAVTKAQIQMVRVDTAWPFTWGQNYSGTSSTRIFTNTICTFAAPDNAGCQL